MSYYGVFAKTKDIFFKRPANSSKNVSAHTKLTFSRVYDHIFCYLAGTG